MHIVDNYNYNYVVSMITCADQVKYKLELERCIVERPPHLLKEGAAEQMYCLYNVSCKIWGFYLEKWLSYGHLSYINVRREEYLWQLSVSMSQVETYAKNPLGLFGLILF